jgi:hypothetical protein
MNCDAIAHIVMHLARFTHFMYSLRPIILFGNTNISRHILVIDISVFAKSNMGRREC